MNTRQKLTLGIAAIFMVTLTIVGVTYAYFVTRVTGDEGTQVQASTVTLGSVKYVAGNGENDKVTLSDTLPGTAVYKTFSVTNTNEDENAADSYYTIFTSNNVATDKGEFIHTADGTNSGDGTNNTTDVLYNCYGYKNNNVLDTTVIEPKMSTELTGDDNATVRNLCFNTSGKYNNVKLTLWKVDSEAADDINTDPSETASTLITDKLTYNAVDDILADIAIEPGATHYYVLKVEYLDTKSNDITGDENQNAENLAGLDVIVSIKA